MDKILITGILKRPPICAIAIALALAAALFFIGAASVNAQFLINELETDPPAPDTDRCQYLEIKGPAGATIPAGTYFFSVNSDGANFGFAREVIPLGGRTIGPNGTLTVVNMFSLACPDRVYDPGTNLVTYSSGNFIGGGANAPGSETYLLGTSSFPSFVSGIDLDVDDDGQLDATFGITVTDGFALIVNPKEEWIYGANAGVVNISNTISLDQPDAVTRFRDNNTPFSPNAFYLGKLANSPENTTQYAAPFSSNFPVGGVLTPGGQNLPLTAVPGQARVDFDGDGRSDISVFRGSEGVWYLNQSTAGFAAIAFGSASDTIIPGDYDGDLKSDLAVFRPSAAAGIADFWVLNSNSFTVSAYEWGVPNDIAVNGDYDGDQKTDIAVFRPSAGAWFIRKSSDGSPMVESFGTAGDIPLVMNHDGDNKDNLAVYRPGDNTWYLARNSGAPSTNYDAVPFGTAGDKLVPADYDGDGKDDVAVFRPSTGNWIILRSSTGTAQFITFGASGDVPAPGDYDGDGAADQAIYRNGTWWLNRSTAGASVFQFGAPTDIPVPSAFTR